ncbi:MAG: hypothetical protein MJ232_00130 [archaeon]|nr:hypothetical protein [archaeon]
MENIIFQNEEQNVEKFLTVKYIDFLNYFLKFEKVYDLVKNDFIDDNRDKIIETYPHESVSTLNKYTNKKGKEAKGYKSVLYYLRSNKNLLSKLLYFLKNKKISNNEIYLILIKFRQNLIKTLASIYNLLCEFVESGPEFNKNKFLILEACPTDMRALKTRDEAINLKCIIKNHTPYLPIVRIGTSRNEFYRVIKFRKIEYIHFCGHGSNSDIKLMGYNGGKESLSNDEFVNEIVKNQHNIINLIFLNCCCSKNLAVQCKKNIKNLNFSIGTNDSIDDELAREYSREFYTNHLIKLKNIEESYNETEDSWENSTSEKFDHADSVELFK